MTALLALARSWYVPRRKAFAAGIVPIVALAAGRWGLPDELVVVILVAVTPAAVHHATNG